MPKSQKNQKPVIFIDYVPAELRENKRWEVVYYAKPDPENKPNTKLKIKRHRVKPMKSIKERRMYARRMVNNINKKLAEGWSPFAEQEAPAEAQAIQEKITIKKAYQEYLAEIEASVSKKALRPDTARSYKSYIVNILAFLEQKKHHTNPINTYSTKMHRDFLHYVFFKKNNSAATHNNYLTFLVTFSRWCVAKGYLEVDISKDLSRKKTAEKKRVVIPREQRKIIFDYLKDTSTGYHVLCLTAFYCLIRRTEMTKLKVSDVMLSTGMIHIPAEAAKNKVEKPITIPRELIHPLSMHLKKAKNSDYLFSSDRFMPGPKKLRPVRISDTWCAMRQKLDLSSRYQWYSLKDTGITNYLELGIPAIDVKNQARHHSISQTEAYIPKKIIKAVKSIVLADIDF